jgi:hypothetical protein
VVEEVETQPASVTDAVQAGVCGGVGVVEGAARERVSRLFSLASRWIEQASSSSASLWIVL